MVKFRMQAQDMCPHSSKAFGFQTAHLCYQDRIGKEVSRALQGTSQEMPVGHSGGEVQMPAREIYPIGGRNKQNNSSSAIRSALGPKSIGSGLKTTYGATSGNMHFERDFDASHAIQMARDVAMKGAAAHQISAVQQRGSGTLIRLAQLPAEDIEHARNEGHGTLLALADHHPGHRTPISYGVAKPASQNAAAAYDKAAIRQRGEGTLLRLGNMSTGSLKAAHQQGQDTMVAVARGIKDGTKSGRHSCPYMAAALQFPKPPGDILTSGYSHLKKAAEASQRDIGRQKGEHTVLRIGKERKMGRNTMVALE